MNQFKSQLEKKNSIRFLDIESNFFYSNRRQLIGHQTPFGLNQTSPERSFEIGIKIGRKKPNFFVGF